MIFLLLMIYLFALIGYFGIGLLIYINLDTTSFNNLDRLYLNLLKNIFYKNNKNNCYISDNILFYNRNIYFTSDKWINKYRPYETIYEVLCLLFWPLWILLNLIINSFNDD